MIIGDAGTVKYLEDPIRSPGYVLEAGTDCNEACELLPVKVVSNNLELEDGNFHLEASIGEVATL